MKTDARGRGRRWGALGAWLVLIAGAAGAGKAPTSRPELPAGTLPTPVLPDGLGVNIHFTDPKPGEMKMLAAGGFTWVRMDFAWGATERKAGEYDFSRYERLVEACAEHKLRILFILDYANRLYDDGLPPHTDAGRAAMANWAAAAVARFKGRGILWEMWNEPNIPQFWKPQPNVEDYAKLALAVGKAVREAAPGEAFIGPATSQIDLPFLESCFKAGLLEHWSAVSVHPYRQKDPETAADEYRRLRLLIARYAPQGKAVPILSGEWGYSTGWRGFDEERQAKYLPRQWLTNLANDVPLSIWYDWHDDGPDPKEAEHHFGTVRHEYRKDGEPVYEPKPAYVAAQTLAKQLAGYRFNKRLAVGDVGEDFVLLFSRGEDVKLAVWTRAKGARKLAVPASAGAFAVADHLGKELPDVPAEGGWLAVAATDAPQYLSPKAPNDLLRVAAAWERAAIDWARPGGGQSWLYLDVRNPLGRPIKAIGRTVTAGATPGNFEPRWLTVEPGAAEAVPARAYLFRDAEHPPLKVEVQIDEEGGGVVAQWLEPAVSNPLRVTPLPPVTGRNVLPVRIEDLGGAGFTGRVSLTGADATWRGAAKRVALAPGAPPTTLLLPFAEAPAAGDAAPAGVRLHRFGLRVEDDRHNVAIKLPVAGYRALDDFTRGDGAPDGYTLAAEGDAKVASEQSLAAAAPPDGPLADGVGSLAIRYRFDSGQKYLRLIHRAEGVRKVEGEPKALAVWVYGDASGNWARMRFTDATGQTFQPGERITWAGWRQVSFPLGGADTHHWGGAADGVVHYPIRIDTLFLLDSSDKRKTEGIIYLAAPTLVYP